MFENRTKTNGSAYLAETLFSRHPHNAEISILIRRLTLATVYERVSDALKALFCFQIYIIGKHKNVKKKIPDFS